MTCKICENKTKKIFDALVLGKYTVAYHQCIHCEFIQTEEPYWLNEAYASAMTALDVGLVYRNLRYAEIIPSILDSFSADTDSFLDYGGGYGLFVRIMRDKGFDFYLDDKYADNLFARHFEAADCRSKSPFRAITSFEVFEHLVNPMDEIAKMFALSDTLIFSTELQPKPEMKQSSDWWYFAPEHGQHVALYSYKTLQEIASRFHCNLYSDKNALHILTKHVLPADPFVSKRTLTNRVASKLISKMERFAKTKRPTVNRPTLLMKDFELYKQHLKESQNLDATYR